MGYDSLILEKRYREFCEVYREKGHLYKENPAEYGDLQPGSQVRALLEIGEYEEAAQVCRQMIQQEAEESARRGYDARSSTWLIFLAIACWKLGDCAEAAFAPVRFLRDRIDEEQLLAEMAVITSPKLYLRSLVPAKFYIALKRYEKGDLEGCRQSLEETCALYERDPVAAMPCEYFLAESWRNEWGGPDSG